MLVKNLVPWAGLHFSHRPGDHIVLDEATANARIAAGLAAKADPGFAAGDNAQKLKQLISDRDAEIAQLKKTLAESADAKSLADARAEADDLRAQLDALTAPKKK